MNVAFTLASVKPRCIGGARETPVKHSEDRTKDTESKPWFTIASGMFQFSSSREALIALTVTEGVPMGGEGKKLISISSVCTHIL